MVIRIRKSVVVTVICVVLFGAIFSLIAPRVMPLSAAASKAAVAGGVLHAPLRDSDGFIPVISQAGSITSERFQRPSKAPPYPNPYSFKDFQRADETPPLVSKVFDSPEDLILAYYGILREASNMLGYSGGCGTIGWSGLPYPYAYELLTRDRQSELTLDQFIDSFRGMGYITLLNLLPAYAPAGTPEDTKYYMVELEVITGAPANTDQEYHQGSRFAYYYGLITVQRAPGGGWKISDIDYIPEDFLCAPMHGWFYLSDAVVEIVYGNNLHLIDQIDRTEQEGSRISIYASGKGNSYRFDFVRLTNGYDILLHEFILEQGVWKETDLLTHGWEYMKLTIAKAV